MKKIFMGFLMVFFLAGCGSGGGGSGNTAPTVSSTAPANEAGGVAVNTKITATFSEEIDPLTITATTFLVTGPDATPVSGTVTGVGATATFMPAGDLAYNTTYTATITNGAEDRAGKSLNNGYQWSFRTGDAPDAIAPTVTSTGVPNGATDLPVNRASTAIFNEAMNPLTISAATFTVMGPGTAPVAGTVDYVGVTATFTPENNFMANTLYTSTITIGAEDLAGNPLGNEYVWSWTTGDAPDTASPRVSSTVPANAAAVAAINTKIGASFSEAMAPLTITATTFLVSGPDATKVSGTVTYVGLTATFTPAGNLEYDTTYTATITAGAEDLAGNAMASNYSWSFTTGNAPDTTPPTMSSTGPPDGAADVPINRASTAIFSEEMDPLTIATATFKVTGPDATPVSGTVTCVGVTAIFTPSGNFAYNTTYTSTITTRAKDLAGNPMESPYVWSWTTGDTPDDIPPKVRSTDPVDGDTNAAINKKIVATFSEAMDPTTISTATFLMTGPGTAPVSGTMTYVGVTATFTPLSNLEYNTTYTAMIYNGAKDMACNPLASDFALATDFVWSFTTGLAPDDTPGEVQ